MSSLRRLVTLGLLTAATCLAQTRPIHPPQQPTTLLDINTATPAQLKVLPGMGDAYVRRVIAGRPYTAKNQLVTRGVLPQQVYAKFQNRIIAHRTTK
jgi:DNA uptake protein ComE-like DNA-binding protein